MAQQGNGTQNGASNGGSESWEEPRLLEGMQQLNILHAKVRNMRETIPKMMEPVMHQYSTPEAAYQAFMKAVQEAQADLSDFIELMRHEDSKAVLAKAKESREQDPEGIKQWDYTEHPDWFDGKKT